MSTIRNRFNQEQTPTTEVSLGPAVYDGERYGKMSERLKRRKVLLQTNDRNPRLLGFAIGFLIICATMFYIQYSIASRKSGKPAPTS
ncbi:hypothetical protein SDRG_14387 [Saprolegnia diclina VS20]|uniref:Uncharacterized protein n=1 Tax=Saprolegnia diclina (strain VS20) TaxID=1156394 RepID=T0R6X1_SAPDV|nr:hypothetical protein SDRG_14387 [Saprolegnia diclina VS20]EQC27803.1 hypothetical protein SDRG_14387 [Saprolegnia diclina VS20]|eukprot:XP_008618733.1 hypothetical protein SDRG_14387 [Saprolegnia diclina VS20]